MAESCSQIKKKCGVKQTNILGHKKHKTLLSKQILQLEERDNVNFY